ncbi:MAG TPA: FGGY-family carbohydrate kinase [Spirochaetia bacterium]|nr:FGGY-family carbohydrate kinase [Spirochaetia bacterium]
MHLVGLDVGTTGCKSVVFDAEGRICGHAFAEYGMICDEPSKAEQNAEEVWELTRSVIAKAVREAGAREIRGLSVSVQGDAVIPVDRHWKPLYPAILGMDYRSEPQARRCEERIGARPLFERTGMRPLALNSIAKIMWLKELHPEIYRRAWKIVTYADFIFGRLGAPPVIDWTMASRTMGFDLQKRVWAMDILEALDVDPGLLSEPVPSGSVVGTIDPSVADELGLPRTVQLVTGGHDQTCAALGAGVTTEGIAVISTGTAEVLSTALEHAVLSNSMFDCHYPCYLYVKPSMFFTFSLNHVGGLLLRWYRDNFSGEESREAACNGEDAYDLMIRKMPPAPTSVMVLPHFIGSGNPWFDRDSKGAILGLTISSSRHDIVRSIMESQTYELKLNLEKLAESGIEIAEMRAVGGGARSRAWLQMKADILDRPVRTLEVREGACLGAAILAGTALGVYPSIDEGVTATVRMGETFEPVTAMRDVYRERFEIYRTLYPTLKNLNRSL